VSDHPCDVGDNIWVPDPRPCWNCGDETHYVEIHFEAPLCPGRCTDVKWAEYDEENRRLGPWRPF
jgi:hypothetical protein